MNIWSILTFIFRPLPDKLYLKLLFFCLLKYRLNLKDPKTFNEKLNRLKLYDRKAHYTKMVDKYAVKEYVADKIGKKYIIPTLGVYNTFDEIDFDKLPNQFVIKCTHDSGGVIVVKDKNKFDINKAKDKINKLLEINFFYSARERPYKNVEPRIIVEKYVKDDMIDDLRDYKFMCFNGNPKYVYITVKNDNIFENWYDMDFNKIDLFHGYPQSELNFEKPKLFEEMKEIVKKLSQDIPFVRVDLHYVNGEILFGEMTFYDWAGLGRFKPREWDRKLGDLINLPKR